MPYERFAELLAEYLRQADQPGAWLARRLKVGNATVSRWLSGWYRPKTPEMVLRLADALRIPHQELLMATYGIKIPPATPPDAPSEPSRPAPQLRPEQIKRIEVIRSHVLPLLDRLENTPFADHDIEHIEQAHVYFEALLQKAAPTAGEPLNSLERFVAELGILLHNVGLCFTSLSDSAYLQKHYTPQQLTSLDPSKQFSLLSQHWHELTAEMIEGSVQNKQHYPDLGISQHEPVDAIVDLVRHLALSAPAMPETKKITAFRGETIRLHLLVGLVRLALSLDITIERPGVAPHLSANYTLPEVQIRHWMSYYAEAVKIDRNTLCVHWVVPAEQYIPHVATAHHDFFVRRWLESIDSLLEYGWFIVPRPARIHCSQHKIKMPDALLAILYDEKYLKEKLRIAANVLAGDIAELPGIAPYYYGAVLDVPEFIWDMGADEQTTYKITLSEQTTNQILWQQTEIKSSPLVYPEAAPPLEPGRRYRWTVNAYKGGVSHSQLIGDFWLLDQAKWAELIASEATLSDNSKAEQHLTMGVVYEIAGCYGSAVKRLQQAITLEPTSAIGIMARRTLADLFELLSALLKGLNRRNDANKLLSMAESQYKTLRQICAQ